MDSFDYNDNKVFYSYGKTPKRSVNKFVSVFRYDRDLFNNMKEFFIDYFDLKYIENKTTKTDIENVIKYDFDKIIEYDNTNGFYEICNTIQFYFNDNLIRKEFIDTVYNKMETEFDKNIIKINKQKNSIRVELFSKTEHIDKIDCFVGDNGIDIKFSINILSLGRYNSKLGTTHILLCKLEIQHYIFVEENEFEQYNNFINHEFCKIIVIPNFSLDKMGSYRTRNYILNYWRNNNDYTYDYIWMLDDNITGYNRLFNGKKKPIYSKEIFTSIEHYISHFINIGVCSHNLSGLIVIDSNRTCIVSNGKQFSSLLINIHSNIDFDFKYNEDHLFSIINNSHGYLNLCFNHILYNKPVSGTQTGGNSTIYNSNIDDENYLSGYNDKCHNTIQFIKEQIEFNNILINDDVVIDKIFKIEKKSKGKSVKKKIDHLKLEYKHFKSNDDLNEFKMCDITEFNSGLRQINKL